MAEWHHILLNVFSSSCYSFAGSSVADAPSVTASISFGGSQLVLAAVVLFKPDYTPTAWQTLLVFWAVMLVTLVINIFCNRWLEQLNTLCLYWTGASVL